MPAAGPRPAQRDADRGAGEHGECNRERRGAHRAPRGALSHDAAHPRVRGRRRGGEPRRRRGVRPADDATPAYVRGPLHLSTGQEAVAAGVCANLERADYLTSTHRGHGHTLAKGADLARMMLRAVRPRRRLCGGKGGSMHIADFARRHARRQRRGRRRHPDRRGRGALDRIRGRARDRRVLLRRRRDQPRPVRARGSTGRRSAKLPVLFVCEDNRWSATTATGALTAGEGAAARARGLRHRCAGRRRQRRRGGGRRGGRAGRGRSRRRRAAAAARASPTASRATCRSTRRRTAIRPSIRRHSPTIRSRARARGSLALGVGDGRARGRSSARRARRSRGDRRGGCRAWPAAAAGLLGHPGHGAGRWRS